MEKWLRIEEFINELIQKFFSFFSTKAKTLTPKKISQKLNSSKGLIENKKVHLKEKISKGKEKALVSVVELKGKADQAKIKAAEVVVKAKETNVREIKPSKIWIAIAAFLAPPLIKLKTWYINLQPSQIVSFVTLSTVATLASVNIYVESKKIAEESRSPASELVEEVERGTAISRRPAYFKSKEKQFKVTNIVLPAYTTQGGAVRKLVIDFTFESSNKYIKNFLWENPHLIQDTLNSKIEPITITFPLEKEGKNIVKEKIIKEMNERLKSLKIKGEIKNVYIHSMIAG